MDDLISKLSEIRSDYNCFSADEEPYYRALSEAIKILSQRADGDTISRQAAIEALARMMPRSYTPDGSHPADEEIFRAQEVFADCIEALEILPSAQPEPTQEIQDILDYLDTVLHPIVSPEHWDVYSKLHDMVSGLPSAQLDGIPLEWIDKHLEWLDNCDNDFAQLAKVSIKAMVELWKKDRI